MRGMIKCILVISMYVLYSVQFAQDTLSHYVCFIDEILLVNHDHPLASEYIPKELIKPNVVFLSEGNLEKNYLAPEAAKALEYLFDAAHQNHIDLVAVSGYRSYSRQSQIYAYNLNQYGKAYTEQIVALPGYSEHQTGLAMDVSSLSNQFALDEDFGLCEAGKWLKTHAHLYGYIIRYPKGKEAITGYAYEPWHIRYVGQSLATYLYANTLTLEEGLTNLERIT